jgi:hypothetical protein
LAAFAAHNALSGPKVKVRLGEGMANALQPDWIGIFCYISARAETPNG